jgi:hypothetical protein
MLFFSDASSNNWTVSVVSMCALVTSLVMEHTCDGEGFIFFRFIAFVHTPHLAASGVHNMQI